MNDAAQSVPRWKRWVIGDLTLRRLLRSLAEIYLCILAFAWLFSDRIAFQPPSPAYAEGNGIYRLPVAGGQKIAVLALTNAAAAPVVLYAHGNAEDLGGMRDVMEEYRAAGFEVYAFDYRGYGISDGKPTTGNAYADIDAVYRDPRNRHCSKGEACRVQANRRLVRPFGLRGRRRRGIGRRGRARRLDWRQVKET